MKMTGIAAIDELALVGIAGREDRVALEAQILTNNASVHGTK